MSREPVYSATTEDLGKIIELGIVTAELKGENTALKTENERLIRIVEALTTKVSNG